MAGEVSFLPSETDYVAAMRLHFLGQVRARKFWGRFIGFSVIAAAVVSGLIWAIDGDVMAAAWAGGVGMIGGMATVFAILVLHFLLLPRRSRRLFRQQKSLHRSQRFAWSDDGACWSADTGEVRTPWSDYYRRVDAATMTLLYLNDQLFHFLPLRAFDADQGADLRATLTRAGLLP